MCSSRTRYRNACTQAKVKHIWKQLDLGPICFSIPFHSFSFSISLSHVFSSPLLVCFGMFWSSLGVSGSATIHRGGCRRIARTGSLQIRDGFFCKVPCNVIIRPNPCCSLDLFRPCVHAVWLYITYNKSRTGIGCGIADKASETATKFGNSPDTTRDQFFAFFPHFERSTMIIHDLCAIWKNLENMIQLVSWLTGYSQPALVFPDFQTSLLGLSGCRNGICLHGPLLSWKLWCCDPGAHNASMA